MIDILIAASLHDRFTGFPFPSLLSLRMTLVDSGSVIVERDVQGEEPFRVDFDFLRLERLCFFFSLDWIARFFV